MRRMLALALVSAIGCSDGVEPVTIVPLDGSYQLTAIDGNPLPFSVTIDGEATPVTAGYLEFTPPSLVAVNLNLGPSGGSGARSIAVTGFYRRVTADSVVFPAIAPPELFMRRTGTTLIVTTQPAGNVIGAAEALGGSHRFTFVEEP